MVDDSSNCIHLGPTADSERLGYVGHVAVLSLCKVMRSSKSPRNGDPPPFSREKSVLLYDTAVQSRGITADWSRTRGKNGVETTLQKHSRDDVADSPVSVESLEYPPVLGSFSTKHVARSQFTREP